MYSGWFTKCIAVKQRKKRLKIYFSTSKLLYSPLILLIMIDSIAQWFLFLLWNLPLFLLGLFVFTALFAWPFSVVYATFGIIFFPFSDAKKLKKMRIEREMPDLDFRTSPLNIFAWQIWQQLELSKRWGDWVKTFLVLIAAWLILMFFVHFLMAHVFGYPPAQQASATTETMLSHLLPPYPEDAQIWIRIFVLGLLPVIIFNFLGQYFTKKVRRFIWDELRYDWFKSFFIYKNRELWIDFGKEYMILHIPEEGTFQKGERPKYQSSFKTIRWKQRDYYSSDEADIKEDKFWLYSSFREQVLGRNMTRIRPYYYLIDYQIYPYNMRDWDEKELKRKTKALIFYFDYEKILDIYLKAGLEKGYIEEFTNQNGQQALRLTTPVETKEKL